MDCEKDNLEVDNVCYDNGFVKEVTIYLIQQADSLIQSEEMKTRSDEDEIFLFLVCKRSKYFINFIQKLECKNGPRKLPQKPKETVSRNMVVYFRAGLTGTVNDCSACDNYIFENTVAPKCIPAQKTN